MPQADQEAIGRTLTALLTGFRNRDIDALQDVYADDADWVNAFGTVKHPAGAATPGRRVVADRLRDVHGRQHRDDLRAVT